jgi:acyl carrier protein
MEARRHRIRDFIGRHFGRHMPGDHEDMFAQGVVNSMFALELVTFLEGAFGIQVDNDDLELDNFRSVDALDGFLQRKLRAAS